MNRSHDRLGRALVQTLGFRKRASGVFTIELAPGVSGWLGLNSSTRHRQGTSAAINPVVGLRHDEIETTVAMLTATSPHAYLPPTVSSPLGYLTPSQAFRSWLVGDEPLDESAELLAAVETHGLPFMSASTELGKICMLLDEGLGFKHQTALRHPVALVLAGQPNSADLIVEQETANLADRTDDAAVHYRNFVVAYDSWRHAAI